MLAGPRGARARVPMSTATAHQLFPGAQPEVAAGPRRARAPARRRWSTPRTTCRPRRRSRCSSTTTRCTRSSTCRSTQADAAPRSASCGVRGYLAEETLPRSAGAAAGSATADLDAVLADEPLLGTRRSRPASRAARRRGAGRSRHSMGAETPARPPLEAGREGRRPHHFAGDIRRRRATRSSAAREAWLEQEIGGRRRASQGARGCGQACVSPPPGEPRARSAARARRAARPPRRPARPAGGVRLQRRELFSVRALWTACVDACDHLAGQPCPAGRAGGVPPRAAAAPAAARTPTTWCTRMLIPLCAAFLDRGQSHWTMPDRERGFFLAWLRGAVVGARRAPGLAGAASASACGTGTRAGSAPRTSCSSCWPSSASGPTSSRRFVERTLLQLPGWSGMFHRLEQRAGADRPLARQVELVDFLAVRLALDLFAFCDVGARLGLRGQARAIRAACAGLPQVSGAAAVRGRTTPRGRCSACAQLAGVSAATIYAASRADVERGARVPRPARRARRACECCTRPTSAATGSSCSTRWRPTWPRRPPLTTRPRHPGGVLHRRPLRVVASPPRGARARVRDARRGGVLRPGDRVPGHRRSEHVPAVPGGGHSRSTGSRSRR